MKVQALLKTFALILFIVIVQTIARAQGCPASTDLNDCINVRARELVKAKADQNSNTKQTETPSANQNSTSLVDQSSASDLVGVGLNLAGLSATSQSKEKQPSSLSVTTTAYTLYSGFKGADPLNPDFYNAHRDWRRFSVTLGYDDEKIDTGTDTQRAKLFGIKYLVINKRDPNRKEFRGDLDKILDNLGRATTDFARIINQVKTFIFTNDKVIVGIVEPDFKMYLGRREIETDRAVLTAANLAKVAEQAALTSPGNRKGVFDAVERAGQAAVASADTPIAVRAAAVEVVDAVEKAAADASKTAQDVANAAKNASDKIAMEAPGTRAHLANLRNQPIRTLFVFENGFLAVKSDNELAGFRSEFINSYTAGPGFIRIRTMLGSDLYDEIDSSLKDLSSFTALRQISLNTIDKIRRAPQLSVAYFTTQRKVGIDEHKAEVIFDWGIANKLNLTANASFEYHDSIVIGGDTRGARFSTQLRYQVNRNDLQSLLGNKTPIYFDLSAEGSRMSGQNSIIKGQAKLTIPLGNTGVQFPISVTVANRTELIKEKEVRGNFGFTFDFSKLVGALQPN
jgi:hypothetical protein